MFYRVIWNCYELLMAEWLRPTELRKLQEKRLRAILKHAYENVPLYRKKLDSAAIKPSDINDLNDLSKLPFTTKQEIVSGMPQESIAKGYDLDDCVRMSTSGTTGGPMPVFYDKAFWDYMVALWYFRELRALDLNPWDRVTDIFYHRPQPGEKEEPSVNKSKSRGGTALGPSVSILKRWQRNVYLAYTAEEIISEIVKYQPGIIRGNSSYLKLLAEAVTDRGLKNIRPKALVSWGELLDESSRRFLESSLQCEVYDSYGAYEAGTIAYECRKKEGLHVREDFVVVELIRNGESVGPGEEGEIVVTGLLNYAMPLIRYRVGDIGISGDAQCSCGRGFRLLKSIEGRKVDFLPLPDGRTISPKRIITAIQSTRGVSRYQLVQESTNRFTLELMRKESDPEVSIEDLRSKCLEILGSNIEMEIIVGNRQSVKAKFRPVISKLTVEQEPRWTKPRS